MAFNHGAPSVTFLFYSFLLCSYWAASWSPAVTEASSPPPWCHVTAAPFLCATQRRQKQLAWADTEAGDDANHAANADVAHEWHVNLQGQREGVQWDHVSLGTGASLLSWQSCVWSTASRRAEQASGGRFRVKGERRSCWWHGRGASLSASLQPVCCQVLKIIQMIAAHWWHGLCSMLSQPEAERLETLSSDSVPSFFFK